MVALEALLLAAALTGAEDTVLLEFTMDGCGACVQMEPTIQRFKQAGYPVQKVYLTQSSSWARRYQVNAAPTFIMLANGNEVDRVVGATSQARLQQMFTKGGIGAVAKRNPPPRPPARTQNVTTVAARQDSPEQTAMDATVRIKVEDASGSSYGTGTIVDVHGGEALVITCGHLFRDSAGRGRISADLNFAGQLKTVPGTLLTYDADHRDIAALIIRPGIKVKAAKVPSTSYRPRVGASAFSIGCDHGAAPSIRRTRVTAIDKYAGPPNIEAAGHPVDGRSGGGLFDQDGKLIGVCNAADMQDDEGLYAALATIQWQLDKINQSRVYQDNESLLVRNDRSLPQRERLVRPTAASVNQVATRDVPRMPNRMPESPLTRPLVSVSPRDHSGAPALLRPDHGDTEMIIILRPKSNPSAAGETFVLPNPSQQLLSRIREQHNFNQSEIARRAPQRGVDTNPSQVAQQQLPRPGEPVIRAQSN